MATSKVIANVSGQAIVFTTPKNVKGMITAINIDNQSGTPHVFSFVDVFTPDASAGTPTPAVQQLPVFQASMLSGLVQNLNINRLSLEDTETRGVLYAVSDSLDSGCVIIVNYHFA
jgi:hypothetical protein